jgi:hypothetical protein
MVARTAPCMGSQAWWEGLLVSEKKSQTLLDASGKVFNQAAEVASNGKYDEAIGLLENINMILPVFIASALQTGRCHWEMHRWEPAKKYFELAQRLDPTNDDTGWTLGLLALQTGDFKAGWEGYERRWGSKTFSSPRISTIHPQWERGLGLKHPIVWTEQGIGDQILYASLIEALAKEVESVVVLIDIRLAGLMQRGCKAKNVTFLPHNAKVRMSDHDSHIPIASMGKYFINGVRDILPNRSESYIKADPHRVGLLKKELGLDGKRVIGLSWASTAPIIGEHKSVALEGFKTLFDIPNTKFINLQYGDAQKAAEGFHPNLITTHIDTFLDLENVAALMELCDVIVSPSNANVHLAAAMGKPVALLDANKLWYWNNRAGYRSLWYPEVRIFQRENMNAPWDLQVKQVKEELEFMFMLRERTRSKFVFMYIGDDVSQPQKMVKSILRYNPDAEIIMCTDKATPDVMGVTLRKEFDLDRNALMTSRLKAFAGLGLESPALYIDTDMLFVDRVDIKNCLGDQEIAMCRRDFTRDLGFNIVQGDITFEEYEGKTIDEVYPFIACATATSSYKPWEAMLKMLEGMNEKYHKWYGDQEALKLYAANHKHGELPESVFGCLPELSEVHDAKIIHYKGKNRKKLFEVAS